MRFDEFINNLLKEEETSDRKKRISALKDLNDVRTFHVEYQGYERHEYVPVEKYVVSGVTLWDALQELPEGVIEDVLYLDEEDLLEFENNDEAVKDYLDNIDTGGFPFLTVYENGELLCGFPEVEDNEEDM
jgi:hypothetical protein